jgi:hypothetical protein
MAKVNQNRIIFKTESESKNINVNIITVIQNWNKYTNMLVILRTVVYL